MFLAVSTNVGDVTPLLDAEFERLAELRAKGVVVGEWLKVDYSGTVLVLDCDGQALDETLASFPIAIAGLATFTTSEITPLGSVRAERSDPRRATPHLLDLAYGATLRFGSSPNEPFAAVETCMSERRCGEPQPQEEP